MTRYIRTDSDRQFAQNLAAIAGDFHTHRLYHAFYDTFGKLMDGFIGNYEICIAMAEALTDWELSSSDLAAYEKLGTPWIEIVEKYVDALITDAVARGELPNARYALRAIILSAGGRP